MRRRWLPSLEEVGDEVLDVYARDLSRVGGPLALVKEIREAVNRAPVNGDRGGGFVLRGELAPEADRQT